MAIKTEWRDPNGLTGISCLSSDTKPDAPAGSICWETDTGNRFERDGDTWQPNGTDGAAHVYGLAKDMQVVTNADGATAVEFYGFMVSVPPTGDTTIITKAGTTLSNLHSATFVAGNVYPIHGTSITVGTSGGEFVLFTA